MLATAPPIAGSGPGPTTASQRRGEIHSEFGWRQRVMSGTEAGALKNFPAQANGAEMMRIAAIAATEAGIEVACPVHDAFLIAAPLDRLEADVAHMRGLRTDTVSLPNLPFQEAGFSKNAKSRALRRLEQTGAVQVIRRGKRSLKVKLTFRTYRDR